MYEKELEFAKGLALEAGELIRKNFVAIGNAEKEWKEDNSPLTITDATINHWVLGAIEKEFPEHSLLGEEESSAHNNTEYVWVCDPIDGTTPFTHGWPTSCFSLGLTRNGESVVGVAYDPYMDRLYFAEKDNGAYVNSMKLAVNKFSDWKKLYIGYDAWPGAKFDIADALPILMRKNTNLFKLCSAVYSSTLVSAGHFSAYIFPGKTPWDMVAIKVIVEEAGGKVTDIFGDDQRYDREINGALVSNGLVHEQLINILSPYLNKPK